MSRLILRRFSAVLLGLSLAYFPLLHAQSATDYAAPVISHAPNPTPFIASKPAVLAATVTDNRGVKSVTLFYRKKGAQHYERAAMSQVAGTSLYKTTLPYEAIQAPGLEYYIQATDLADNMLQRGTSFTPLEATVMQSALSTPAAEKDTAKQPTAKKKSGGGMGALKWVLVAVGVGAIAALAASGGGGDGGPQDTSVVVTGPAP